jgi:hypothetical protein
MTLSPLLNIKAAQTRICWTCFKFLLESELRLSTTKHDHWVIKLFLSNQIVVPSDGMLQALCVLEVPLSVGTGSCRLLGLVRNQAAFFSANRGRSWYRVKSSHTRSATQALRVSTLSVKWGRSVESLASVVHWIFCARFCAVVTGFSFRLAHVQKICQLGGGCHCQAWSLQQCFSPISIASQFGRWNWRWGSSFPSQAPITFSKGGLGDPSLQWKRASNSIQDPGHVGFLTTSNWSFVGRCSLHLLWPVLYSEETLRSLLKPLLKPLVTCYDMYYWRK